MYRAGWLRDGHRGPAQLGTAGYLYETPQRPMFSDYWDLIWNDKLVEAMDYARESGMDQFEVDMGSWFTCYPGPAGLLHALGRGVQVRGVGARPARSATIPHSRPPQAKLPEAAKAQIRTRLQRLGLIDQ